MLVSIASHEWVSREIVKFGALVWFKKRWGWLFHNPAAELIIVRSFAERYLSDLRCQISQYVMQYAAIPVIG